MSLPLGQLTPSQVTELTSGLIPFSRIRRPVIGVDEEMVVMTHALMTEPPELLGFLGGNLPLASLVATASHILLASYTTVFPIATESVYARRVFTALGKEMRRVRITASELSVSVLPGLSSPILSNGMIGLFRRQRAKPVKKGDIVILAGRPLAELALRCSHERPELIESVGGNPKYLRNAYTKISAVESVAAMLEVGTKRISLAGDNGIVKASKRISKEIKMGLMIDLDRIAWDEVGLKIARTFDGDPASATSYGAVIGILEKNDVDRKLDELSKRKISAYRIGTVTGGIGVWKSSGGPLTQHKDVYSLISPTPSFLLP